MAAAGSVQLGQELLEEDGLHSAAALLADDRIIPPPCRRERVGDDDAVSAEVGYGNLFSLHCRRQSSSFPFNNPHSCRSTDLSKAHPFPSMQKD